MKLIALAVALLLSTSAMAVDRAGNSDSGDGGSAVVERMIAANEAALEREAAKE